MSSLCFRYPVMRVTKLFVPWDMELTGLISVVSVIVYSL
jgi:hypothetical protein